MGIFVWCKYNINDAFSSSFAGIIVCVTLALLAHSLAVMVS